MKTFIILALFATVAMADMPSMDEVMGKYHFWYSNETIHLFHFLILEFLADCDSNDNHCISVAEAIECIPEDILAMIPPLDLDHDFEVCADHVDDIMDAYGDLIHDFISTYMPSRK